MARVRRAVLGMEDARDNVAKVALSVQRISGADGDGPPAAVHHFRAVMHRRLADRYTPGVWDEMVHPRRHFGKYLGLSAQDGREKLAEYRYLFLRSAHAAARRAVELTPELPACTVVLAEVMLEIGRCTRDLHVVTRRPAWEWLSDAIACAEAALRNRRAWASADDERAMLNASGCFEESGARGAEDERAARLLGLVEAAKCELMAEMNRTSARIRGTEALTRDDDAELSCSLAAQLAMSILE